MADSIKYIFRFLNIYTYFEGQKYLSVCINHILPKLFLKKFKIEKRAQKYHKQLQAHTRITKHQNIVLFAS